MTSLKNKYILLIIILATVVRFYHLNKIPPSLYSDETDFGYNAYSLLKTGHDEYGVRLPTSLRSFGDWKSPLPSYIIIPSIYVLGLSEYALRLPAVLLGIASVILTYYITKELLKEQEKSEKVALLSAFFIAISPWHILQSRAVLPMIPGNFLLLMGIYFFLLARKSTTYLAISAIFFALTLYDYLSFFIVTPLILLLSFLYSKKQIRLQSKISIIAALIALVLLLPLFSASLKEPNILFGRAKNLSVFSDPGIIARQWELANQDHNAWVTRLFHNKYELYAGSITSKFLSHLNPNYLFLTGDKSPPFQIPNMGILYIIDFFFLLIGLFCCFKQKIKIKNLLLAWYFISLIPAALTFQTPASNRSFNAITPLIILLAIGLAYAIRLTKLKIFPAVLFSFIYSLSFSYFLNQYFIILPKYHSDWWNYGWKEVVKLTNSAKYQDKKIIISDVNGMPYIYFLFHNYYDPSKYQKEAKKNYYTDKYGFEHVQGFDRYTFIYDFNWQNIKKKLNPKTVYIVPSWQAPEETDYQQAIYYPDGKIAFMIFINE